MTQAETLVKNGLLIMLYPFIFAQERDYSIQAAMPVFVFLWSPIALTGLLIAFIGLVIIGAKDIWRKL